MLSSDPPDFALVSGTEMSLEVNCSIDPCCGFTGLSPYFNDTIDDQYVIRLHARFYHSQTVGNLSGRDMTQMSNILGIDYVDETLILISADRPIRNQQRFVFRA